MASLSLFPTDRTECLWAVWPSVAKCVIYMYVRRSIVAYLVVTANIVVDATPLMSRHVKPFMFMSIDYSTNTSSRTPEWWIMLLLLFIWMYVHIAQWSGELG